MVNWKMVKSCAAAVMMMSGSLVFTQNAAQAASPTGPAPGQTRVISTAGMQKFDVGGGATVYTNTPGAITYFGWNTGSSNGAVTSVGGASYSGSMTVGR